MFERFVNLPAPFRIPFSGNEFLIDYQGLITNRHGVLIPQIVIDGHLFVEIELWGELRLYKVALLVAITFKPTSIPFAHWKELDVLFVDDDFQNCHPANLVWKFPDGGLVYRSADWFRYIPGFSTYVISEVGEMLNAKTGVEIKPFMEECYAKFRISPDIGKSTTTGRHRLVCLAWHAYPANVDKLVTNHINGKPGDDRKENLEWVTRFGNNAHAIETGLRRTIQVILVKNCETGEVREFKSPGACAEHYGLNKSTIKYRVFAVGQPLYPGNLLFKLKSDPTPWREVTELTTKELNKGEALAVRARNAFTNEIRMCPSIAIASHETGVPVMTIHNALGKRKLPRPNHGWDFKREEDCSDWPIYSDRQLEIYKAIPVGPTSAITLLDTVTGTEHFFLTQDAAADYLDKTPNLIRHALRKNCLIAGRYKPQRV